MNADILRKVGQRIEADHNLGDCGCWCHTGFIYCGLHDLEFTSDPSAWERCYRTGCRACKATADKVLAAEALLEGVSAQAVIRP